MLIMTGGVGSIQVLSVLSKLEALYKNITFSIKYCMCYHSFQHLNLEHYHGAYEV